MKKICTLISLLSILFLPAVCAAQADSTGVSLSDLKDLKFTIRFDGTIKAKYEVSATDGMMRFNVRNSRLGLRGEIGDYVAYRIQVELSNEGVFSPLDLYGTLKPWKGFYLHLGQTHVPFDNDYIISPNKTLFANRAFVGKFFTPGSRDIGAVAGYKFRAGIPWEAQAGVFNGGKINNPQWTDRPSYAARLIAGTMQGWRSSVKIYRYRSQTLDQFFWGADLRYATDRLRIETEVMHRHSYTLDRNLLGAYLEGAYAFDFNALKIFHYLTPALRWDAMGYQKGNNVFDVNRLTAGLNFGLSKVPYKSTIRIDYEQYFVRKGTDFIDFEDRDTHVADNKFTIELMLTF